MGMKNLMTNCYPQVIGNENIHIYLLKHFINQCLLEELLDESTYAAFINHVFEKYFMTWEKDGYKAAYMTWSQFC